MVQADSTVNQDFRLWAPVNLTFPLSYSFIGYMEVNPWVGNYQPSFREENRVYQQLLYRRKFSFVKVSDVLGWKNDS